MEAAVDSGEFQEGGFAQPGQAGMKTGQSPVQSGPMWQFGHRAGGKPVSDSDARASSHSCRLAAVFFVGNRLMLDEGIGPAAFDEMHKIYDIPENVLMFDVGCMSLDMLPYVEKCDFVLTVDAVDGTGQPAGTVFRYPPEDMARQCGALRSLHDLALVDLFDAASLLGYEAEGFCVGMQVQNMEPAEYVMGLTPPCYEALPLLIETVEAELHRHGFPLRKKG